MRAFRRQGTATKWARLALKCGLLLTDAKMWASIREQLQDGADDLGDQVRRKYDDAADRLAKARDALEGRRHWMAPTVNFLGAVGIGMGLGILFAPASGEEARAAVRHKVVAIKNVAIKNKVGDMAAGVARVRAHEPTGTERD